jgi:DNA-directed RNA polymerase specialized sigma24 family protein
MTSGAKRSPLSISPQGNAEQLEEFHRRLFLPLVRRATWKHGLSKEDARDIVQEAFVLAIAKIKPDGNPKAWLTRVVDNLSANYQRKVARRSRLSQTWRPVGLSDVWDETDRTDED